MSWIYSNGVRSLRMWILNAVLLSVVTGSVRAGNISGTYSNLPAGTVINLTSEGPADWIHWGLTSETSINRKKLVAPQVSDYTLLVGAGAYAQVFQYADNTNGYAWSDGSPTLSVTNTTTGLYAYTSPATEGTGFQITAPADTRPRVLKLYLGVYSGQGEITASLSDNSASPYVESSLSNNANGDSRVYMLTYAADSPGKNLVVTWLLKKKQGGATQTPNVTLQAAALATPGINVPPGVSLVSPSNTAQFASGQPMLIEANGGDVDGTVTNVAFFSGDVEIGNSTNNPYHLNWLAPPLGLHRLTAVATDNLGDSSTSAPVNVMVYGRGGFLSGSLTTPLPASLDLSAEGVLDWINWGLTTASSVNRKAAVPPMISDFTQFGTNVAQRFSDGSIAWSWTNGTPTLTNLGSLTGIFLMGRSNGFELAVPATTQPSLLKIYAGLYGAQIGFRAYLSDFSAPAYYRNLSSVYDTVDGAVALQFASASPGQLLIVRLENLSLFDPQFGNLRLMSATLQVDDSVLPPVLLLEPRRVGDDFLFSFETLSNRIYTVEGLNDLGAPPWTPLAVLPGTDGKVTFTNSMSGSEMRFYRVQAQ